MRLVAVNWSVPVTSTPAKLATVSPKSLQTLVIQVALGSSPVVLGDEGHTTYGASYPMIAGDTLTLTWQDFDPEVRASLNTFDIWAVCNTGGTATLQLYGWARQ